MREVERERRWRHAQMLADGTGVDTLRASLDEQTKDRQPGFMAQRSEKFGGVQSFHISSIVELSNKVQ